LFRRCALELNAAPTGLLAFAIFGASRQLVVAGNQDDPTGLVRLNPWGTRLESTLKKRGNHLAPDPGAGLAPRPQLVV
jgi:hypothetical protein